LRIKPRHALRGALRALTATMLFASGMQAAQVAQAAPTEIQFWHAMESELGERVNEIAQQFNASQSEYKIVPVFKGTYDQTLAAGIAAYRSGDAPAILQVYEVGTATLMQAKKAVVPVYDVMKNAGVPFDEKAFVPTIASFYGDARTGHLVSMPFNSSTPLLYFNRDAFRKAGLNPDAPPKTWPEVAADAAKLKAAGLACGFTTGWQGWIQIENYSAWQAAPIATRNNGFDGADAELEINKPVQVAHIAFLQKMAKDGTFTYVGRKDEATAKFYSGDCGIMMGSSGAFANVQKYAKFQFGTGMMPYDPSVKGAPQNAIIGGASLWVLAGKNPEVYKGVAKFLAYLSSPADTATRQMLNKSPLPYTKGLRLGNMPQIRTVVDEELEQVWTGSKTPQQALDSANSRGNELLRRFEKQGG
jgi:sn-glycerol 3-phosphate transport system substrate-binding protein